MAKISDLTKITSPNDGNVIPISDGLTTKKITFLDLKTSINSVASSTQLGTVKIGSGLAIDDTGVISVTNFSSYSLPAATDTQLGGVLIGSGLSVSETGLLSATYTLPTATPTVLGGVKVGDGLTISNGILSTLPISVNAFDDAGISIGNDDDIQIYIENSITPTIKDIENGVLVFSVYDTSMAGNYADVRLVSRANTVGLGDETAPSLLPDFSGQAMNLGTPSLKWNKVYANNFVGNVVGTAAKSTEADSLLVGLDYLPASTSAITDTIAARDSVGNISANNFIGNVTGNVTGNSSTATQLQTSRTINGEPFNGTQNITITAANPQALTRGNYITGGATTYDGSSPSTWNINATAAATPNTVVARDTNGDFQASTVVASNFVGNITGNVTGNVAGNALTATTLFTPRKINGVDFDGSQDIQLPAATARVDELAGSIKMWGSSTPPTNWLLCNGQSISKLLYPTLFSRIGYNYGGSGDFFNLPNLINKFPVGAGGLYGANSTGGNKDQIVVAHQHNATAESLFTGNVLPNHTHTFTGNSMGNHSHGISDPGHRHWISSMATDDRNITGTGGLGQEYGLVADAGSYSPNDPNKSTGRYTLGQNTGISVNLGSAGTPSGSINSVSSGVPSGTVNTNVAISTVGASGTDANMPPYIGVYYIIKASDDGSGGGTLQAGTGIDIQTSGAYSIISSTVNTSTFLPTTGGTMSGFLTLNGNPSNANHAANKAYVDTKFAAVPSSNDKLPLTGGSLSGPLYLSGSPSGANQAATKSYVDNQIAQIGNYQKVLGYRHYGWGVGYNTYGDHYWEVLSTSHQYIRFGNQYMEISLTPQATNSRISVFVEIAFMNQYVAHFQIRRAYGNGAFSPTITNTSPVNYFAAKTYNGAFGTSGSNLPNSNYTHYGRVENQQGAMERETISYTEFTNNNIQPRTFRVAACGQWNNSPTWLSINDRRVYRDMPTYSTMTIVEWVP